LAAAARRRAALSRAALLAIANRSAACWPLVAARDAADAAIEAEVADLLGLSREGAAWLGRRTPPPMIAGV
ncbi:MAG: hypothetical protein FJZ01_26090, partial [Candidatus Sericytochromatia bacterium]|nr:hypothetical protein [Candidatus Tanganyikabacteria bacterium]